MHEYSSKFALRDKVFIDGDKAIVGVVIAIEWQDADGLWLKVSRFAELVRYEEHYAPWRLTLVPA